MIRRTAFSICILLTLAAPPALADPSPADVARAQKLVRQAEALEQRGQLVEAREALTAVVFGAAPTAQAQQLFADLGRRIARVRLEVDVPPGAPVTPSLSIDGEALPPGAERLPVPVNPGHHMLVVQAPDLPSQTIAFDALESSDRTIAVHLRLAPTLPPPVAAVQPPPVAQPPAPPPALRLPPVAPDRDERLATARRARFSVGRFFLESLGSAVVGSLAAYGTFKAACGSQACLGGSFEALGANIVVTPLTVWGLGQATGGDGGLGWAFLGGLVAFSGYTTGTTDPTLPLVIGVVLMPFTSALIYEVSSDASARRALGPAAAFTPNFAPLIGPSSTVVGATAGLSGRF
jgi:hypothetical protein